MTNNSLVAGWWQRWNRSLFRYLGRRVRTSVDIEDLAQETYLRLLRAPDLGEVRNPQAYMLRVASHVVVEWRDHQPHPDSMAPLEEDSLVDEHPPEFELEARLAQKRLDQTLESVSPTMRAVLVLRLRDDRSCSEIAQDLELTARQVRRYLARGYERLRLALEG
jgi:RNA polymerase sigma factor (sigma-70 family)